MVKQELKEKQQNPLKITNKQFVLQRTVRVRKNANRK